MYEDNHLGWAWGLVSHVVVSSGLYFGVLLYVRKKSVTAIDCHILLVSTKSMNRTYCVYCTYVHTYIQLTSTYYKKKPRVKKM